MLFGHAGLATRKPWSDDDGHCSSPSVAAATAAAAPAAAAASPTAAAAVAPAAAASAAAVLLTEPLPGMPVCQCALQRVSLRCHGTSQPAIPP